VTVALVYVVGRAIFQREAAALWYAFAYAFVAILGSLDYYRWGGLQNLIGMMLLLAGLVLALAGSSRASLGLGTMTFASTYLVHHHTMLVILGICSAVVVVLWYAARREEARRLVIAVVGSLVLSAFWLIPLAARVEDSGDRHAGIQRICDLALGHSKRIRHCLCSPGRARNHSAGPALAGRAQRVAVCMGGLGWSALRRICLF
jgi:hypothetical protein